jgi:hypothetical protein
MADKQSAHITCPGFLQLAQIGGKIKFEKLLIRRFTCKYQGTPNLRV